MELECRFVLCCGPRVVGMSDEIVLGVSLAQSLLAEDKIIGDIALWANGYVVALVTRDGQLWLDQTPGAAMGGY